MASRPAAESTGFIQENHSLRELPRKQARDNPRRPSAEMAPVKIQIPQNEHGTDIKRPALRSINVDVRYPSLFSRIYERE